MDTRYFVVFLHPQPWRMPKLEGRSGGYPTRTQAESYQVRLPNHLRQHSWIETKEIPSYGGHAAFALATLDGGGDAIKKTRTEITRLQEQLIALEDAAERLGVSVPAMRAKKASRSKKKARSVKRDEIKPGSAAARAVDILREAKRPLTVNEILKRMGQTGEAPPKTSLVSAVARHVKKEKIFYRAKAGTYGLLELKGAA